MAQDAFSICMLANSYYHGLNGIQQDHARAIELFTRAADLGNIRAHCKLGDVYYGEGGDLKKAKFHFEAAELWQDTKWQDTTLEAWSVIMETWNEL